MVLSPEDIRDFVHIHSGCLSSDGRREREEKKKTNCGTLPSVFPASFNLSYSSKGRSITTLRTRWHFMFLFIYNYLFLNILALCYLREKIMFSSALVCLSVC